MGKQGLVGKLLLDMLPDPVMGFVEPDHMVWKHDLHGLLVGELAVIDERCYPAAQGVYTFVWQLSDIQEELILEILFGLDGH